MNTMNRYYRQLAIGCFVFSAVAGTRAFAQNTDIQKGTTRDETITKNPSVSSVVPGPALEGPVNPDSYFVGPSDVLSVNIWISPPVSFVLTVTPEGTLIIPTIAEVKVGDMTLAAAKAKVIAEVMKKYLIGNPTVTLMTPRPIVVNVMGYVQYPGPYTLHSSDRVDKAVHEANKSPEAGKEPVATRAPSKQFNEGDASKRNILLKHRDGSVVSVDLLKFYASRDDRLNPYLREGDEIVVPKLGQDRRSLGVYGAFYLPGSYEMVQGDRLLDAIEIAHGFLPQAVRDSVVLTRFDESGHALKNVLLDASKISDTASVNVLLQPGDRIVARERQEERQDYRVMVEGEVFFPGTYPITKDRTRITEILGRAGGFTQYASLGAVEIVRLPTLPDDISFEREVAVRGNTWAPDTSYVRLENDLRVNRQLVTVDFKKLVEDNDSTQNIILQSGDRIVIPSLRHTVLVFGQVVSPGNVPFVFGKDADYYVRKAGGYTDNARTGDVAIIKRGTRQWLKPGEGQIEDGDYIWVPKTVKQDLGYYLSLISQAASVIGVAVTVLLVVRTYR